MLLLSNSFPTKRARHCARLWVVLKSLFRSVNDILRYFLDMKATSSLGFPS